MIGTAQRCCWSPRQHFLIVALVCIGARVQGRKGIARPLLKGAMIAMEALNSGPVSTDDTQALLAAGVLEAIVEIMDSECYDAAVVTQVRRICALFPPSHCHLIVCVRTVYTPLHAGVALEALL
jgi:hypothetical protein